MSAREFVDSNVLVYGHDLSAGSKREAAISLMERLWASGSGCLSIQVLQEFFVVSTRRLGLPSQEAQAQVERLGKWRVHSPAADEVVKAIELHRSHGISFWDAMIVQRGRRLGCGVLWSEDLNPGQVIAGVEIRNPF